MLERALRTFLLMKQPVFNSVGGRVHVGDFVPLTDKDLPAIGIEADPQDRERQIDGQESPLQFQRFDIVIKALEFAKSIQIGNLVASAFRAIPFGATIFTAPGTVLIQAGDPTIVGHGTGWTNDLVGQEIHLRDGNGVLVYSGTVTARTSATTLTVSPALAVSQTPLLWDLPGASLAVQIVQVDILGSWNDKEEDHGHSLAVKPRVVKIQIGWLEDTSTI
ncbi:hypothetical protein [Schlesneria paludicola]|uniref:hypothetical protein n=1 Tax=Schlesneria paludicola TaxID=360056 RepID=UPI00029AA66E|nr:hypothetical protein [Schlesneria paludicola]